LKFLDAAPYAVSALGLIEPGGFDSEMACARVAARDCRRDGSPMTYMDRIRREIAAYDPLDVMLADVAVRIQLSPTDYHKAVQHYDTIAEWIDREDSPLHGLVDLVYPQGGFAIGATIACHSTDDEFDIDGMSQLALSADVDPELPLALLHEAIRGDIGSSYHKMTERKTRCVTVNYDGMHLDLTPTIRLWAREERTGFIFHSKPNEPHVSGGAKIPHV
jgi:hypothetical protein